MSEKVKRDDVKADAFVSAYVASNGNASEAYRVAFPHSRKWTDGALNPKASTYLKSDKIQTRIVAIRNASFSSTVATALERKERLTEFIRARDEDPKHVIKAIEVLAKIEGDFAPTKVEVDIPLLVRDFASCGGSEE